MLGFLKALFNTANWNNEPGQQALVKIILDAARKNAESEYLIGADIRDVFVLVKAHGWSEKETANRCVHAVSMIRGIAEPRVYAAAKREGEALYKAFTA